MRDPPLGEWKCYVVQSHGLCENNYITNLKKKAATNGQFGLDTSDTRVGERGQDAGIGPVRLSAWQ